MIALALTLASALALDVDGITTCLVLQDPVCAQALWDASADDTPDALLLGSEVAFYDGRYVEALELAQRAEERGLPLSPRRLALLRRTVYATAGWVEEPRGNARIRFRAGLDVILIDEAGDVLRASDEALAPILGTSLPAGRVVEIYPDVRSFTAASSLDLEDVVGNGVVGLAKFARLLLLSPRASADGYDWKDTLAHEYIHLVVARATLDKAPIWLQEGIAKFLDGRWRQGGHAQILTRHQQALLSEALAKDNLVSFEEMHPSLAKMPDAERASLAYAQLAMLVQYAFETGGEDVLLDVLPRVAEGKDPRDAFASACGAKSFADLERSWRGWLAEQSLASDAIPDLKLVLEPDTVDAVDPVLAEHPDRLRHVAVGRRLMRVGEPEAALISFEKAKIKDGHSPVVDVEIALAHLAVGRRAAARALLESSLMHTPSFPSALRALAALDAQDGRLSDARTRLERALDVSPFHEGAREQLVRVCQRQGDAACVKHQRRVLDIRRRGGDDVLRDTLHLRHGRYELPRRNP